MNAATSRADNPYVGPRAFRKGEELFGRERETESLIDRLLADRIVALHSQSGAGKTSLLQAKVIPRLAEEGLQVLAPMRVGHTPASGAAVGPNRYMLSALSDLEKERPNPAAVEGLAGLTLDEYLASTAADASQPIVLVFDQFEELLTVDVADLDAKREFCRMVGVALQRPTRWAIFAMREEFLGALAPFLGLIPTRLASRYRLELLSPESAREAIERPALARGVSYDEAAIERLLNELRKVKQQGNTGTAESRLGPFIEPVHLQVVCTRLWNGLPPGTSRITLDQVKVGDVDAALGDYYADAVGTAARQGNCGERNVRDWIEERLVARGVRAQALRGSESEYGVTAEAVQALEKSYIVRHEERRGAIWYELAHDRLVDPIRENNARWRDRTLTETEKQAERWEAAGRPDHLLMRSLGPRELWRFWSARKQTEEPARSFMAASVRRMVLLTGGVYGLLIILGLGLLVWQSERSNRTLARARDSLQQVTDSLKITTDSLGKAARNYYDKVWGLAPTSEPGVELSKQANRALQTVASTSPRDSRQEITVEYFYKRRDAQRVEFALRELGYRVVTRPAELPDFVTNALFVGSEVPVADVRIIALALLRSGAELQRVCNFRNPGTRPRVVQVGSSAAARRAPVLDVKALESLTAASLRCGPGASTSSIPSPSSP